MIPSQWKQSLIWLNISFLGSYPSEAFTYTDICLFLCPSPNWCAGVLPLIWWNLQMEPWAVTRDGWGLEGGPHVRPALLQEEVECAHLPLFSLFLFPWFLSLSLHLAPHPHDVKTEQGGGCQQARQRARSRNWLGLLAPWASLGLENQIPAGRDVQSVVFCYSSPRHKCVSCGISYKTEKVEKPKCP